MIVFAKIARFIRPFNSFQYFKELERISKFVKACFCGLLAYSPLRGGSARQFGLSLCYICAMRPKLILLSPELKILAGEKKRCSLLASKNLWSQFQ